MTTSRLKWIVLSICFALCFASASHAADKNKPKDDAADNGGVFGEDDAAKNDAKDEAFGEGGKAKDEGGKKAKKNAKNDDAKPDPDDEPKKDGADDKKPMDEAAGNEEAGFGEGRAKADAEKAKGLDPAELESNKDLAKYVKTLRKQLKKEDGYYVIRTGELSISPDKQPAKGEKVAMKLQPIVNFEVIEGREATVARVVKFMGEYDPPWEKKTGKGKKGSGGSAGELPKPKREWAPLAWYEGAAEAENFRNLSQQKFEAGLKAEEEKNKPRNNKY